MTSKRKRTRNIIREISLNDDMQDLAYVRVLGAFGCWCCEWYDDMRLTAADVDVAQCRKTRFRDIFQERVPFLHRQLHCIL